MHQCLSVFTVTMHVACFSESVARIKDYTCLRALTKFEGTWVLSQPVIATLLKSSLHSLCLAVMNAFFESPPRLALVAGKGVRILKLTWNTLRMMFAI